MALRAAALLLALWSPPADAQLRGQAPAPPPVDTAAEVDHRTSSVRIIGHNLLLTGGIEHFYEVFGFANETMHNESGCFSTAAGRRREGRETKALADLEHLLHGLAAVLFPAGAL